MRIHHQTMAIAAATVLLAAPAFAADRDFNLDAFDAVDASAGIEVRIAKGDTQSVRAEAKNRAGFDNLGLYVDDGTLIATTDYDFFDFIFDGGILGAIFHNQPNIVVYVTMPQLNDIRASSGARVEVGDLSGPNLRVSASSGANIDLQEISYQTISMSASSGADIDAKGTCINVRGNVSSGADINAGSLECNTAKANASSGGDLTLFASQSVEGNASSGGDITIKGNPQNINVNTSSGGDVDVDR